MNNPGGCSIKLCHRFAGLARSRGCVYVLLFARSLSLKATKRSYRTAMIFLTKKVEPRVAGNSTLLYAHSE